MGTSKIIITDLTRFGEGHPDVCTAGMTEDGVLVRPIPYIKAIRCEELGIHPGAVLEGTYVPIGTGRPHVEDASHGKLRYLGPCSSEEFRQALEFGLFDSIEAGFENKVEPGERFYPPDVLPPRSIITIQVDPARFSIVRDGFNASKVKASFTDGAGASFRYMPIADRGFADRAKVIQGDTSAIDEMNTHIDSQKQLYLRIGLTRVFTANNGKRGFWLQLNGIYTFPDYLDYIRCYDGEEE